MIRRAAVADAKTSEPWAVLLAIAAGGALLIFAAFAMMWAGGRPQGIVLTVLWAVPVSAVMAVSTYFARGQKKGGTMRTFLIVEAIALLGAAALTSFTN